ncbi:ComEC/Rec2 family competence protein [Patescibacteria group bacterium]|nr:ComEC/Rec2 family competence protein [Patescibacteria group bacterium]
MTKLRAFIFFTILLILLGIRFAQFFTNSTNLKQGEMLDFQTSLSYEPEIILNFQKLKTTYQGQRITVLAPRYPQFFYGDKIKIRGTVEEKEFVSSRNNRVTKVKTISLLKPKIELVKSRENNFNNFQDEFLAVIFSLRQKIISIFNAALPASFAGLMLGITFGIKETMPETFLDNLRQVGVVHVIAASGMNVTMTAGFLSSISTQFFKRQTALVISIFGIIFYAFLAGFEPSIIRASIMGILVFSSQILGRQSLASYSLFLTAFVMLFVSPEQIENLGFQLSFLSTAGILYIQPLILRIKLFRKPNFLTESLATTFCAQLATLPILILIFGTYSLWAIPVNMLVLWTIPFLMLIGVSGSLLGLVFVPFGQLSLLLSLPLLIYFERIVNFFAGLNTVIMFPALNWAFAASYYCFLIALIYILNQRYEKT